MSDEWTNTYHQLPPEGVEVETDNAGRCHKQTLVRKGQLWFLPDMSMYVYYTPTFWRHLR